MKPPRRVALSPQAKGCRGAGESCVPVQIGATERTLWLTDASGKKPKTQKRVLPWRCRGLHGLRANSPAVGRRTPTGMRRLRVQERCEPIGRIHSMEWALADENKKKKAGRKNQTVGGPRSTARAITV